MVACGGLTRPFFKFLLVVGTWKSPGWTYAFQYVEVPTTMLDLWAPSVVSRHVSDLRKAFCSSPIRPQSL
jgi:hypothetical protein